MKNKDSSKLPESLFYDLLGHFLDVINVIQGAQSFDDLAVCFIFFQLLATDGNGDGVNAESGILIGSIGFDIIDFHAKLTDRCNKILQIGDVF